MNPRYGWTSPAGWRVAGTWVGTVEGHEGVVFVSLTHPAVPEPTKAAAARCGCLRDYCTGSPRHCATAWADRAESEASP